MKAKYLYCVIIIFFCVGFYLTAAHSDESITFTTYYPAPYGVYNQLLTSSLGVGDTNASGGLDSGDVPPIAGDVWIKGKVGIGATCPNGMSPEPKLTVGGTGNILLRGVTSWGLEASESPDFQIVDRTNYIRRGVFDTSGNVFLGGTIQSSGGDSAILSILNSGNVGIGKTNPTLGPLQMGSGAYVTPGGVWTNASSRAYKQDIVPLGLDRAMKTLAGLQPVLFSYKRAPDEQHVGFISEDVPELVATKDRTGLSAMDIVAVLTKAVQQQQKEIEELRAEVRVLRVAK